MFDCFDVRFAFGPPFLKKAKLSKWLKSRESRTNMDIILLFLTKPVDQHGITITHITYPPLGEGTSEISILHSDNLHVLRH